MRRKPKRNQVLVNGIDDQWQLYRADMHFLQMYNDGYRYLLIRIDVFFKICMGLVPLKIKQSHLWSKLLKIFCRQNVKLHTIQQIKDRTFSKKTL